MNRAFAKFELKSADADTGVIVGLASTPQTDRVGDIVEPGGAVFDLPLPLLFAHDHGQPVGAVTEATVTSEGIRIVAKLALDASERVRECWALIKAGALRGLSVGFLPLTQEPIPGGGYRFGKWDWHELSVVAVPANQGATIQTIKHYAAQPVSALRIHPVKAPRKEARTVTIHDRTAMAENTTAAATVQWLARAEAVAAMTGAYLLDAVDEIRAPAEIARRIKAVAESTTSQPGLAGGSTEVQAFVSQASETSVLLRMVADRATYPVPLRTAVYLPDADMTAQVIGEGLPIPIQGFSLDRTTVDSFKIGGAFAATEDVLRNVSPAGQAFLNQQLRAAVAKAADVEMFARLTNSGTFEDTVDPDVESILTLIWQAVQFTCTRATDRPYFAVSPELAAFFGTLPGLPEGCDVYGGRFLKRPAVITEALSGPQMAVVNGGAFVGAVDRLEISASNAGTVEMLDNPTNDSVTPTPTTQVSLFQTNSVAIKAVAHLACEPVRENALALINLELPSGT